MSRCQICNLGRSTETITYESVSYRGYESLVDKHSVVCNYCHTEYVGAREMRLNKKAIKDYQNSVDKILGKSIMQRLFSWLFK